MQVQVNVSGVALYFTIMMYVIMYYHVVRNQDSHFHDTGLPINMENLQSDSEKESKRYMVLPLRRSWTFISCKSLFLFG